MEIMSIKSTGIYCNYEWTSFYTNNDDMVIISQCNAFNTLTTRMVIGAHVIRHYLIE